MTRIVSLSFADGWTRVQVRWLWMLSVMLVTACATVNTPGVWVDSVDLVGAPFALPVGGRVTLEAIVHATVGTDRTVLWFSTNPSVASVDEGAVEGIAEGTATIVVRSRVMPSVRSSATLRVVAPPSDAPWLPGEVVVRCGGGFFTPERVVEATRVTLRACGVTLSVAPRDAAGTPLAVGVEGRVAVPSDGVLAVSMAALSPSEPASFWWYSPALAPLGAFQPATAGTLDLSFTPPPTATRPAHVEKESPHPEAFVARGTNRDGQPVDFFVGLHVVASSLTPSVLGIDVTPVGPVTLDVGAERVLTATVRVCASAPMGVAWSSSQSAVASVDAAGRVTGVAVGTAIVTVRSTFDPDVFASVTVFVHERAPAPGVLAVTIDGAAERSVPIGSGVVVIARVTTIGGAPDGVTWSSTDPAIASVDASGRVVGVAGGSAVVWARSVFDPAHGASVRVHVPAVLRVAIPGDAVRRIPLGDATSLQAVVTAVGGASEAVTWSSSHPKVATVTAMGRVDALDPGKSFVTAVSVFDSTRSATVTVIVSSPDPDHEAPAVSSVAIDGGCLRDITVGQSVAWTATVTVIDGAPRSVQWSTADALVATVSQNGMVTAVAAGSTTITARSTFDPSRYATAAVTVTDPTPDPVVVSVVIDGPATRDVSVGAWLQLTATVTTLGGAPEGVAWSSADPAIASVTADGWVSGVSLGATTITARSTFDPSQQAVLALTVPGVVRVDILGGSERTLLVGDDVTLTAVVTVVGDVPTSVDWLTSDPTVATVAADGLVMGVAGGEALIRAVSRFDPSRSDALTVRVPAVWSVAIAGAATRTWVVGDGEPFAATVTAVGGAPTTVTWSTSDADVVSVTASGEASAVAVGSAVVSATSTFDLTQSASVDVTVSLALPTSQFGSAGSDHAAAVAVGDAGQRVIAGGTNGSLVGENAGHGDAFVRMVGPTGVLLWETQFGTTLVDLTVAVAIDGSGRVIVAGTSAGLLAGANAGKDDAFVRVLDPCGVTLWETQFGTLKDDRMAGAVVDRDGRVIVAGTTSGALFGANAGHEDAFVRVFTADGVPVWAAQFGSDKTDVVAGVAVDAAGRVIVAGSTRGSLAAANAGQEDVFLRVMDAWGALVWQVQEGTPETDAVAAVAVDEDGRVIVAGTTTGAFAGAPSGHEDAFLLMWNSVGARVWQAQLGSPAADRAAGLAVDGIRVVLAGSTAGDVAAANAGHDDAFVVAFDARVLVWTAQFGSSGHEVVTGAAIDPVGRVIVVGSTTGDVVGPNAGHEDAFVYSIGPDGALP